MYIVAKLGAILLFGFNSYSETSINEENRAKNFFKPKTTILSRSGREEVRKWSGWLHFIITNIWLIWSAAERSPYPRKWSTLGHSFSDIVI